MLLLIRLLYSITALGVANMHLMYYLMLRFASQHHYNLKAK